MGVLDTLDKIMNPEDIEESEKQVEKEKKRATKKNKNKKCNLST